MMTAMMVLYAKGGGGLTRWAGSPPPSSTPQPTPICCNREQRLGNVLGLW